MAKPPDDDIRAWFDSLYVGAWDVPKDTHVTIERVERGIVEGEQGRKDKAPLIYFKGASKPMVCNKTNLKTIASICGSFKAKDWIGKRITLYATTCKGKAGGVVDCVRVRPKSPGAPDTGARFDGPVDAGMRERQMAEAGELVAREPGEEG